MGEIIHQSLMIFMYQNFDMKSLNMNIYWYDHFMYLFYAPWIN